MMTTWWPQAGGLQTGWSQKVEVLKISPYYLITNQSEAFSSGWDGKNPPAMWDTWVQSLGWEKPLEESMATHASIPAWRIPQTEETGGLPSVGSHTAGHDQAMKQSHSEEGPQADHTSWTLSPHAVFKGLCQKASGGSGPCTWAACPPSWVPCKYTPSFLQTPAISLAFCTAGTRALAR